MKSVFRNETFYWQLRVAQVCIGQDPKPPFDGSPVAPIVMDLIYECSHVVFSSTYPPRPQGFHLQFLFFLQTLLQFGYLALSTLGHLSRISPLQFWLFGTNPIVSLHPTPCCRVPHSESGLCCSWKGMETTGDPPPPQWTQWRTMNSGQSLRWRNFYWLGMNGYRNYQKQLSTELGQGKFCWGTLGQWHFISWEGCW